MGKFFFILMIITIVFGGLVIGIATDAGKGMYTQAQTQGILDASTLAGTDQQREVVLHTSMGVPDRFKYEVEPVAAQIMAQQTFDKNVSELTGDSGGYTLGAPQWSFPDSVSVKGTVDVSMQPRVTESIGNALFGKLPNTVDDFVFQVGSTSAFKDQTYP